MRLDFEHTLPGKGPNGIFCPMHIVLRKTTKSGVKCQREKSTTSTT